MLRVGGLDLAGVESRPSGAALLDGDRLFLALLYTDSEICGFFREKKPRVIALDAPLGFPASGKKLRDADRALLLMGLRVLPPVWSGMKKLVLRALRLVECLYNMGVGVVETHPASALKTSGCRSLQELLEAAGLKPLARKHVSRDEADAAIAAIVAKYFSEGRASCITRIDGEICLLPKICDREDEFESP